MRDPKDMLNSYILRLIAYLLIAVETLPELRLLRLVTLASSGRLWTCCGLNADYGPRGPPPEKVPGHTKRIFLDPSK
jgi:hypothetical protein